MKINKLIIFVTLIVAMMGTAYAQTDKKQQIKNYQDSIANAAKMEREKTLKAAQDKRDADEARKATLKAKNDSIRLARIQAVEDKKAADKLKAEQTKAKNDSIYEARMKQAAENAELQKAKEVARIKKNKETEKANQEAAKIRSGEGKKKKD